MAWTFYDANGNALQLAGAHTLGSHTGTLAISAGGTGATSDTAAASALGVGTEDSPTFTAATIPTISGTATITLDATTDIVLDADGGDIFFKDGGTTFGSATNTSGNLIFKSGTTTALTFDGADATISGNLTVSGTTTQIDSTTLTVADTLIKLNQAYTGTAFDIGFVFTRGNGSSTNIANRGFIWDESADEFSTIFCNTEAGTTAGNVTVDDYANLHVGKVVADDTIELGHATDTTIARASAGDITVEGNAIYRAGGTDIPVGDGGTGASTLTQNGALIGNAANAVTAVDMSTKGGLLVGDGTGNPSVLAIGANGLALVADSTETTGLKYASAGVGLGLVIALS